MLVVCVIEWQTGIDHSLQCIPIHFSASGFLQQSDDRFGTQSHRVELIFHKKLQFFEFISKDPLAYFKSYALLSACQKNLTENLYQQGDIKNE